MLKREGKEKNYRGKELATSVRRTVQQGEGNAFLYSRNVNDKSLAVRTQKNQPVTIYCLTVVEGANTANFTTHAGKQRGKTQQCGFIAGSGRQSSSLFIVITFSSFAVTVVGRFCMGHLGFVRQKLRIACILLVSSHVHICFNCLLNQIYVTAFSTLFMIVSFKQTSQNQTFHQWYAFQQIVPKFLYSISLKKEELSILTSNRLCVVTVNKITPRHFSIRFSVSTISNL